MTGTFINVAAIVLGGVIGLLLKKQISTSTQQLFRALMGLAVVYVGLSMFVKALADLPDRRFTVACLILLSLILGNILGKAMKLQARSDALGALAKKLYEKEDREAASRFSEGFITCSILFCMGPMAILGALSDGMHGDSRTLVIKAAMDGVSTIFFVSTFGWGPIFAALPVFAYQGSIAMIAMQAQPQFPNTYTMNAMHGAGGLLIVCVSVLVFNVKRTPIADYLPSLAVAPALAWLVFR